VICSNSGEIPHLINRTGGGLIFPEAQSDILADRIVQLIEDLDLRRDLAKKGRSVVLKDYSNQVVGQRFIQSIDAFIKAF